MPGTSSAAPGLAVVCHARAIGARSGLVRVGAALHRQILVPYQAEAGRWWRSRPARPIARNKKKGKNSGDVLKRTFPSLPKLPAGCRLLPAEPRPVAPAVRLKLTGGGGGRSICAVYKRARARRTLRPGRLSSCAPRSLCRSLARSPVQLGLIRSFALVLSRSLLALLAAPRLVPSTRCTQTAHARCTVPSSQRLRSSRPPAPPSPAPILLAAPSSTTW